MVMVYPDFLSFRDCSTELLAFSFLCVIISLHSPHDDDALVSAFRRHSVEGSLVRILMGFLTEIQTNLYILSAPRAVAAP